MKLREVGKRKVRLPGLTTVSMFKVEFIFIYVLCVSVLPVYITVPCARLVPTENRRGH